MEADASIIDASDLATDVDKARIALEIDVAIAEANVNKARAHLKRNQADALVAQADADISHADIITADLRARKARLSGDDTVARAAEALAKDNEVLDDAIDEDQNRPQDSSTNAPARRHIWRTVGIGWMDGLHVSNLDQGTSTWHHSAIKFDHDGGCNVAFSEGACQKRYHLLGHGECQKQHHLIMVEGDVIHVKQRDRHNVEVLIEMGDDARQWVETLWNAMSLTVEDRAGGV